MEQNATVIFASDFILDDRLDQIAAALRERGYRVLRGREQKPPAIAAFDPVDCPRFFGQTDVILMTTRSRVTREILEASSKLRGVVFPTIGTESLDLNAAGELGIVVANGPTPENFLSMDESTAMLMTALLYGLHQTERLAGWQVRIVVFDPFLPANQAPPGGEIVDLPSLLRQSDIVSLHMPLSEQTRHLIGAAQLAAMKASAYLINTARGGVVDEAAL